MFSEVKYDGTVPKGWIIIILSNYSVLIPNLFFGPVEWRIFIQSNKHIFKLFRNIHSYIKTIFGVSYYCKLQIK